MGCAASDWPLSREIPCPTDWLVSSCEPHGSRLALPVNLGSAYW